MLGVVGGGEGVEGTSVPSRLKRNAPIHFMLQKPELSVENWALMALFLANATQEVPSV